MNLQAMLKAINLLAFFICVYSNPPFCLPVWSETEVERCTSVNFPNAFFTVLHILLALLFIVAETNLLMKANCTTDTIVHSVRNYGFFSGPLLQAHLSSGAGAIGTSEAAVPKDSHPTRATTSK
jgi:hypothetical protein